MKPELLAVYEETLENEPRSKLDPYRELILRWRRQGKTYRHMAKLLLDKCGLKVGTMTLHEFVKLRSRPRKPQPELDLEPLVSKPAAQTEAKPPVRQFTDQAANSGKMSPEEFAEQVARMKALKAQPVVQTVVKKRYEYNPDEPLTLERKKDE